MYILKSIAKRLARIYRKENAYRLFWSVYYPYNFGDWIGPFLYTKLTKKEPFFALPSDYSRDTVIMSAGSILSMTGANCIVWGSGIISRKQTFSKPWKILAVRGPYTKERCVKLGYACPDIFGDPGLLLPFVYSPISKSKKYKLGIIPHFRDIEYIKENKGFIERRDVLLIDVRFPIENIINMICSCKYIVSSSLHGIIVSQAFGVPVGWVSFGDRLGGDGVKFYDHFAAIGCFSPECLKNALKIPVDELIIFAKSGETYDFSEVSNSLLSVCPFKNNTVNTS